jgi:sugar phosphate isomerase/epimerase
MNHSLNRRTWLQSSVVAMGALALGARVRPAWALPKDHPYFGTIGLQLYTVRNQLDQDQTKTLKSIADAGYYQVELMDVVRQAELAKQAKDLGLKVNSSFHDWRVLALPPASDIATFDEVLEAAKELDLKYLVFGYIGKGARETVAQYQAMADRANAAGEKCRKAGIQLCYHNHSFEFAPLDGGKPGFEVFAERFDPENVKWELDVFWVAIGGYDPIETLGRLQGRVAQVHLKDLKAGVPTIVDEGKVPVDAFQELGDGTIDMAKVLDAARVAGAEVCHVEQDQSPDPLASIKQSYDYLARLKP